MVRVLLGAGLLALVGLVVSVQSAAPPGSSMRLKAIRAMPLVDRMYAEIEVGWIDDPKTSLLEALDAMSKEYGVGFDIYERAFRFEMLNDVAKTEIANPNPVPPMKAPLGVVLQQILDRIAVPSGACWLMRGDRIQITTGHFAEAEITGKRAVDLDEEIRWGTVLPWWLVNVDLRKKPLAEALDQLADRSGQVVVLDESLTKEYAKRSVTARLRNVPVSTAVLMLASQADLGMVKMDNTFYVTTEEKATRLNKRFAELNPPPKPTAKAREAGPLFDRLGNEVLPTPRRE